MVPRNCLHYGQTPEDLIVRDDEDGADIQDGEQFPTNDTNRVGQRKHSLLCQKKTEKEQLPTLKIKIRGFQAGANRKKPSSKVSSPSSGAKPISAIHNLKGDDTDSEPENTQVDSEHYDTPDEQHDSESDDTQETNPNSKCCRATHASDRQFLKEVESKAKKPKKEETAPKRPRGRPRKNAEAMSKDEKAEKKCEKEFSVVVYVEVAVPPKLHAGKTHRGDKMVPQAPRRCGPFSMFRRTKWSSFLDNITAVTSIDKENLLLPGMTWRMQGKKELDGLPLQSRDAFKAMRDILKNKARKEQPVLLVYHPIPTGPGGEKQANIDSLTATETSRWTEKVNICCCL